MSSRCKYANKALKQSLIALSACVGYTETLTTAPPKAFDNAASRRRLRLARDHLTRILDDVMMTLDIDEQKGIVRYAKSCELTIAPSTSKACKEYALITPEELAVIVKCATDECRICLYDEQEIQGCALRRALIRAGAVGESIGRKECPFQP